METMIEFFDATTTVGARKALAAVVADQPCCNDYRCRVNTAAHAIADALNGKTPMAAVASSTVEDGDKREAHRSTLALVIERWTQQGVVPAHEVGGAS